MLDRIIENLVEVFIIILALKFLSNWIFKIDEIVDNQKKVIEEIKKLNRK